MQTVAREFNKPKAIKSFHRQFNARICSKMKLYIERFNSLLQFTVGEAQRIVSDYSY